MESKLQKMMNYDDYWTVLASLVGIEAGIVGILTYQPVLIACSIFLFLFTSILIIMDYSIKRILIHAFVWVELVAWFVYMFRN